MAAGLLVFIASTGPRALANPIYIAPTTNYSLGNATNAGLFGSIYNFNAVAGTYTVSNLLNPANGFDPVEVGSYQVNTSAGISYGASNSADSQPLTTWLGGDGSTVVYNGASHITQVFNAGSNVGTLLTLTGYIRVLPSMVNVPQTFALGLDDGGSLVINGTTIIDNGGIHAATVVTQTAIFTTAGIYPVTLGYYDGHATQAVLSASLGGAFFVSTPGNAALQPLALDSTAQTIQDYVTAVAGKIPSDLDFLGASTALEIMALTGANAVEYGDALKELAPIKYGALEAQMTGGVDFITNDLDDYLAHRRTDEGTFRPGNNVDLGGVSVVSGDVDPGLQELAGHLLAYNAPQLAPGTMSDTPAGLTSPISTPRLSLDQHWNFFTRGIVVMSQNLSDSGISSHTDNTSGTLQFGADYQLTPSLLVGMFFGYSHGQGSLDQEGSESTYDSYMPGVYASYAEHGWYANALAAGGVNEFDVNRNIDLPGFSTTAYSRPTGEEEYDYISGGRDFHAGNWTLGPMAGLQYVHTDLDSFTESNAGLLDLTINSHSQDSLRSRLGGRVYYVASSGGIVWRPFLDAAWQHEFMENNNSLTSQFTGAGAGTFTVPTVVNSRESALISVGADIDIDADTDIFTAYRVETGESHFFAQSVEAGVKINF